MLAVQIAHANLQAKLSGAQVSAGKLRCRYADGQPDCFELALRCCQIDLQFEVILNANVQAPEIIPIDSMVNDGSVYFGVSPHDIFKLDTVPSLTSWANQPDSLWKLVCELRAAFREYQTVRMSSFPLQQVVFQFDSFVRHRPNVEYVVWGTSDGNAFARFSVPLFGPTATAVDQDPAASGASPPCVPQLGGSGHGIELSVTFNLLSTPEQPQRVVHFPSAFQKTKQSFWYGTPLCVCLRMPRCFRLACWDIALKSAIVLCASNPAWSSQSSLLSYVPAVCQAISVSWVRRNDFLQHLSNVFCTLVIPASPAVACLTTTSFTALCCRSAIALMRLRSRPS